MDGHVAPSRLLLGGDFLGEADWLGGVPFYLSYLFLGISGLMIIRCAAIAGIVFWSWRASQSLPVSGRLFVTVMLSTGIQSACAPCSQLWDVIGMTMATCLFDRIKSRPSPKDVLFVFMLAAVWSNLAPMSMLILIPWMSSCVNRTTSTKVATTFRPWLVPGLAALLGCCATPRGPLSIWDSLRQIAPWLVESHAILERASWPALWSIHHNDCVSTAWYLFSAAYGILLIRNGRLTGLDWLGFVFVQILGIESVPTALAILPWIAFQVIGKWRDLTPKAKSPTCEVAFKQLMRLSSLVLVVAISLGVGPFSGSRLGWGIARSLEDRELPVVLAGELRVGTAHCTDILSAGALCWNEAISVKPYLIPARALLNGTLRRETLLTYELENGWIQQHLRSDGTSGGSWLTLQSRQTVLIISPSSNTRLIRSLEPTIWKPLSLDSPIIPFAMAGDSQLSPRIVQVLGQRATADTGAWQFSLPETSGNDRLLDVISLVTGWPDLEMTVRQAAVLRAMNLPQAAMRVLRPLLSNWNRNRRVRNEFVACQTALIERTQLICGEADPFRTQVLDEVSPGSRLHDRKKPGSSTTGIERHAPSSFTLAARQYVRGEIQKAIELLNGEEPDKMSARASLLWESGHPAEAREIWLALVQRHSKSRQALIGQYVLDFEQY